jgi:copper(I)-binding protein
MNKTPLIAAALLSLASLAAQAQTTVAEAAWIRGTVPQQKATGMFASVTSAKPAARLVSGSARPWPAWWKSTRWRWTATR